MMSHRLYVRTPSRLHFGLLGWGPEVARQFGGIGLMIDSPGIELIAEPADALDCRGTPRLTRRADHRPTLRPGVCVWNPLDPSANLRPERARRAPSASGSAPSSHWPSLASS